MFPFKLSIQKVNPNCKYAHKSYDCTKFNFVNFLKSVIPEKSSILSMLRGSNIYASLCLLRAFLSMSKTEEFVNGSVFATLKNTTHRFIYPLQVE